MLPRPAHNFVGMDELHTLSSQNVLEIMKIHYLSSLFMDFHLKILAFPSSYVQVECCRLLTTLGGTSRSQNITSEKPRVHRYVRTASSQDWKETGVLL